MKTTVDFAFEKLASQGLLVTKDYKNLVVYREAKTMEKDQAQQYAEFAIECDRKGLPILEFDGWIDINTNEKGGTE
jgi:hypothetical protein